MLFETRFLPNAERHVVNIEEKQAAVYWAYSRIPIRRRF